MADKEKMDIERDWKSPVKKQKAVKKIANQDFKFKIGDEVFYLFYNPGNRVYNIDKGNIREIRLLEQNQIIYVMENDERKYKCKMDRTITDGLLFKTHEDIVNALKEYFEKEKEEFIVELQDYLSNKKYNNKEYKKCENCDTSVLVASLECPDCHSYLGDDGEYCDDCSRFVLPDNDGECPRCGDDL